MKSLKEVLEGIEAFKKDMEDLGVKVMLSIGVDPDKVPRDDRVKLLGVVYLTLKEELGEDLEAEG